MYCIGEAFEKTIDEKTPTDYPTQIIRRSAASGLWNATTLILKKYVCTCLV